MPRFNPPLRAVEPDIQTRDEDKPLRQEHLDAQDDRQEMRMSAVRAAKISGPAAVQAAVENKRVDRARKGKVEKERRRRTESLDAMAEHRREEVLREEIRDNDELLRIVQSLTNLFVRRVQRDTFRSMQHGFLRPEDLADNLGISKQAARDRLRKLRKIAREAPL